MDTQVQRERLVVLGAGAGELRSLSMGDSGSSNMAGSSSSSSSSSSSGAVVGAVTGKTRKTCQMRVYDNGCEEKRSCRDCLNAAADDDGLECYLDALAGTCSPFSDVSPAALAATAAQTTNASERLQLLATNYEVFASTKQRYCSANDGACTLCEAMADLRGYAPSTNQLKKMTSDRNVCFGANNCICVAKCEGQAWTNNAGKRCSAASVLAPGASSDNTKAKMLLFIGLFAMLQFLVLMCMYLRKRHEISRRREANGPYNTAGVVSDANRLQLPGWMAWQSEMRDQEKHEAPYVNLHKLRPSASRHTLTATASEASIVTQPLSSPPSTRHRNLDLVVERLST